MNIPEFYESIGIKLEESGTRWKGICPFHVDTTPSFVVYPIGDYHCFGCGAHGSIRDLQKKYNIESIVFKTIEYDKDPIKDKLDELKKRYENDLLLHIADVSNDKKFKAYDAFDRIFIDAYALIENLDVSLVDLVLFLRNRFSIVFSTLQEKVEVPVDFS